VIHRTTRTVCPMMNRGVPKKGTPRHLGVNPGIWSGLVLP
jgi:hypothetical protein